MKPGHIETVPTKETQEAKAYWTEQLKLAGLNDKYHAVARKVPGHGNYHIGIFIEEKPTPPED
jgi:hypothetical protein